MSQPNSITEKNTAHLPDDEGPDQVDQEQAPENTTITVALKVIKALTVSASKDETRYSLQHLHFAPGKGKDGKAHITTTNGSEMQIYTLDQSAIEGPPIPEDGINIHPSLFPTKGGKNDKITIELAPVPADPADNGKPIPKGADLFRPDVWDLTINHYGGQYGWTPAGPTVVGRTVPEKYPDFWHVWNEQKKEKRDPKMSDIRLCQPLLARIAKIAAYFANGDGLLIGFTWHQPETAIFVSFSDPEHDLQMLAMPARRR